MLKAAIKEHNIVVSIDSSFGEFQEALTDKGDKVDKVAEEHRWGGGCEGWLGAVHGQGLLRGDQLQQLPCWPAA